MYAVIDNKTAIIKEQWDTGANGLDEQFWPDVCEQQHLHSIHPDHP